MKIKNVSLGDYTSIHIGGNGLMVVVESEKELMDAVRYAKTEGLRVHIFGGGTNTFFGEDLKDFLFIKMNIKGIELKQQDKDYYLQAYAGENWDDVVRFSTEKNLWGIENLSYIPGTVGAAPVQNIGAYGVELKDVFVSLRALHIEDLSFIEMKKEDCDFGYRDSFFKKNKNSYLIISVLIKLSLQAKSVLVYKPLDALVGRENITPQEVRDIVVATRKAKLPDYNIYPNAGSFFKNPIVSNVQGETLRTNYPNISLIEQDEGFKIPAAWLIEHVAESKGVRIGDVGTWPNQPLVIVNYGSATADDVLGFSNLIIKKIEDKTGITLEREVNFVK